MQTPDRLIASCRSWSEFWELTKNLTRDAKGRAFEHLTQLYLQTASEYQAHLKDVWLLRDVPHAVCRRLNLPSLDEGIDIIACTKHGEYWAIQSKFRERDQPLTRRELGTFTSLAFNTCSNIALAVVAHTCSKPISKRRLMRNTTEIGLDRWEALDREAWGLIVAKLHGKSKRPKPRRPLPHQARAISEAERHFVRDGAARGRLIMPCGTGKSLTAYWIAEALKAKRILVAVPSLALVRQSLAGWTREFLAHGVKPDWLCVCSDETVGNLECDTFVGEVYDLGVPAHTEPAEISAFLRARSSGPKIVFTTYQSSPNLAAAARNSRVSFDLGILDEAHKTVGKHSKTFATLLSEKNISIRRRLFMTATERVARSDREDVLSMEREEDYGARFFHLSFKEAIKQGIIADYKVLTLTVSNRRIRELIDENRILDLNSHDLDEAEAQSLAAGIALKRVYQRHGVKHAISFHRSIRAAERFRDQQDALNRRGSLQPPIHNFHISSKKTAGQRSRLLQEFVGTKRALMTNARCLTEGVDVPAIDCVMFADPKQSRIDIVQASGRALRKYPGKQCGYIVVPLVVPDELDFRSFAETTAFRQVAQTITALSTQDERIAEEFRLIETGRLSKGKIVEIDGDVPVGLKMELVDFAEAISTRVWASVGRANWRRFEECRAFVRALGLNSVSEWFGYCKSGKRPHDVPSAPHLIYAGAGWAGYGDWLGTGRIADHRRLYRSLKEARLFVRALGLRSQSEWREYTKSEKKPDDIPANPEQTYAKKGWVGYGDWLGTGTIAPRLRQYRPFKEARAFVHALELKSNVEWLDYTKSGKKPGDIPAYPNLTYAEAGWAGIGDWLGTGTVAPRLRQYRPFQEARAFVHGLGLKSQSEWRDYTKSGKKPDDIPANPNSTYAQAGWAGYGDWLGTGNVAPRLRQYRPFNEARTFVHALGLSCEAEWRVYTKSGKKPDDIPADPSGAYASAGWAGWGCWLGTGRIANQLRQYRSFNEARAFVRSLGLKSRSDWEVYCKSGRKPDDIPADARSVYAAAGWAGWSDWLGTDNVLAGFDPATPSARTSGPQRPSH